MFPLYFNLGISIVEIKNTNLLQITCFKEHKNMTVEKNLSVTINFYKKHCLLVVTWNKNNLSKQVVPITYTMEKRFFTVAIFLKVCESFLFQRREDQINTVYEK